MCFWILRRVQVASGAFLMHELLGSCSCLHACRQVASRPAALQSRADRASQLARTNHPAPFGKVAERQTSTQVRCYPQMMLLLVAMELLLYAPILQCVTRNVVSMPILHCTSPQHVCMSRSGACQALWCDKMLWASALCATQ